MANMKLFGVIGAIILALAGLTYFEYSRRDGKVYRPISDKVRATFNALEKQQAGEFDYAAKLLESSKPTPGIFTQPNPAPAMKEFAATLANNQGKVLKLTYDSGTTSYYLTGKTYDELAPSLNLPAASSFATYPAPGAVVDGTDYVEIAILDRGLVSTMHNTLRAFRASPKIITISRGKAIAKGSFVCAGSTREEIRFSPADTDDEASKRMIQILDDGSKRQGEFAPVVCDVVSAGTQAPYHMQSYTPDGKVLTGGLWSDEINAAALLDGAAFVKDFNAQS